MNGISIAMRTHQTRRPSDGLYKYWPASYPNLRTRLISNGRRDFCERRPFIKPVSDLFLNSRYLKLAYFEFFYTHLSYGTMIWGHSCLTHRVLVLQKKMLLQLLGVVKHCRPLDILHEIHYIRQAIYSSMYLCY